MSWVMWFMLVWMFGTVFARTSGGLVHFLLALAFALVAIQWINGRRVI